MSLPAPRHYKVRVPAPSIVKICYENCGDWPTLPHNWTCWWLQKNFELGMSNSWVLGVKIANHSISLNSYLNILLHNFSSDYDEQRCFCTVYLSQEVQAHCVRLPSRDLCLCGFSSFLRFKSFEVTDRHCFLADIPCDRYLIDGHLVPSLSISYPSPN